MTEKSRKEIAREDYCKLLDKINSARGCAFRKGICSTEIWLGPKQREIIALNWLLDKEELSLRFPKEFPVLDSMEDLILKLKDSSIYGMKIKFSEEDGVRAGITFD